ncbi:MAG: histidine kinase N-terminal 7TM domain-containing protein [Halalkalicoccus sp.]
MSAGVLSVEYESIRELVIQPTPAAVLIAVAALVAGAVAVLAWRERPEPGAASLAALMCAAAWWSTTHLGVLLAETLAGTLLWARLQWFASVALPVAWVVFALEYTGRDKYVRPPIVAGLAALPALTVALVWTNDAHGLIRESATLVEHGGYLVVQSVWGPWFYLIVGYAYLLAAFGSILFVQLALGSSFLYRSQAAALLVGAAIPWLSHLVYLVGAVPGTGLDLMAISFSGSGIALLAALSRGKLLEASPAASRLAGEFVLDRLDDGVVVVDSRERVVDANPAAVAVLGGRTTDLIGKPAETAVPGYVPAETGSEVAIEGEEATRYFDVRVSTLEDYHRRPVGRAIVLRDVTERRRHRQRLTVLHRILRHNLRNELTVIRGHADRLAEAGNEGATVVDERAARLLEICEKAAEFERTATADGRPTERLDTAITEAVSAVRVDHPETRFEIHELSRERCDAAIEVAVRNLIENAARHNTNEDPVVTVEATVEDATARIRVADNGPGIPAIEREVLETGLETQLSHGSGIGLWIVHWTVEIIGGAVEFDENEPIGSVVTVRIPTIGSEGG